MNYVKDYAEKVISGEILAGKKVKLAAKISPLMTFSA